MTTYITPACMHCGKTSEVEVDSTALHRWQNQRWLIQVAFPDLDDGERELIKSGIHESCWTEMFGSEDDEGEDFADPDPMYSVDEHDARL